MDKKFMKIALEEAQKAYDKLEVPIGAVIVKNGEVIAKAHNDRESSNKAISHAEIIAITKANEVLKSWRLDSCILYVTIEPCPMCAGAIIQSRMKQVVYGAQELKSGVHKSVTNLFDLPFNHKVTVEGDCMQNECSKLMTDFFKEKRK